MKYPFTKCVNPRICVNRYTHQEIEVSCGVCKACLMNRANKMTMLCSIEESEHKYCMFFTLTYSDEYVPMARPYIDNQNNVVRYVSVCERLHDVGNVICVDTNPKHCNKGWLALMDQKTHLPNAISYTSVREAQLFLKRIRKHLIKYSNEKLRYYFVSEYGPKTFRAHYHGMFFCNDDKTYKGLSKIIRTCWPYGRVDYSLSRGKCASYVARYVNSTYFIPPFLAHGSSCPFSLHSTFFAVGFYKSKRKEVYENEPKRFVRLGRTIGSKYVEFMPWRSLATTFYPRCKGYDGKTFSQLLRSYSILREVKFAFGKSYALLSFPQIADNIIHSVLDYHKFGCKFHSSALRDVSHYFLQSIGYREFMRFAVSVYDTEKERLRNMIVNELYISRHFLDFVCCHDTLFERCRKVRLIQEYWKERDYSNLVDWYRQMDDYTRLYPDESLDYFYVNKPRSVDLMSITLYKQFVCDSDEKFERSIKHKRQNDANKIFINS